MAARRAGVVTIDLVCRSTSLQAAADAGSAKLGQLGAAGRTAGRSVGAGMAEGASGVRLLTGEVTRSASTVTNYGERVFRTVEAVTALAASHVLATAAVAKYTSSARASVSVTDQLVNGYRALRIVLSPTVFTAASLAVGILAEETIRLVNARARLIDQQSQFAATKGISFGAVDQLDLTSRVAGANSGTVRSLFAGLQSQFSSNQQGVLSSLKGIGVEGGISDPAVLGKIAAGLQSIEDPAEKARVAVALFGSDSGQALETLTVHFANNAEMVDKWGLKLDSVSRTQIYQFRQDLINLKENLISLGELRIGWENFKTGTEIVAAAAEDMSKRGIRALDEMIARWVPGMDTLKVATAIAFPGFGQPAPIPEAPPPPLVRTASQDTASREIMTQDIVAQMNAANQRNRETLEGQRTLAAQKEAQSKEALEQAQNSKLTPEERNAKALEAQSAAMVASAANRYVKTMEGSQKAAEEAERAAEDSQKAAEEAERAAEAALRSIQSYERSVREQGMTPVERVYARRDDLGFAPGSAYGQRATDAANVEASRLVAEEQARIDKQNAELYQRPSKSAASESAQITFSGDIQAINKQTDEILKVWSENIVKGFKDKVIPLQQVSAVGREREEAGALGANAEERLRIQASYDQQRVHSFQQQVEYQKELAALEASDLQIKLQAALQAQVDAGKDVVLQARAALELDRARLNIQEQELRTAVELARLQSQHPDWSQFFGNMKAGAEEVRDILQGGVASGTNALAATLTRGMTGQHMDWGKMFEQQGRGLLESTLKSGLQQGAGWLGGKMTPHLDGQTESSAPWVRIAGGVPGLTPRLPSGLLYGRGGSSRPGEGASAAPFGGGGIEGLYSPSSSPRGTSDSTISYGDQASGISSGTGAHRGAGVIDKLPINPVVAALLKKLFARKAITPTSQDDVNWGLTPQGAIPGLLGGGGSGGGSSSGAYGAAGSAVASLGGLFNSGGAGAAESITSSIAFPAAAAGTDEITPGQAYMVGEHGPEVRTFEAPGAIIPNEMLGSGGGFSHNGPITVNVGSNQGGTEMQVYRGIRAAHDSAIATSMQAMQERARRVPQR